MAWGCHTQNKRPSLGRVPPPAVTRVTPPSPPSLACQHQVSSLPLWPHPPYLSPLCLSLTPTESAIHTHSSSKHCRLFKLLRSSCHLIIHWVPQRVTCPAKIACFSAAGAHSSRSRPPRNNAECPLLKTFSTSASTFWALEKKWWNLDTAGSLKFMLCDCLQSSQKHSFKRTDFQPVTPSSTYFRTASLPSGDSTTEHLPSLLPDRDQIFWQKHPRLLPFWCISVILSRPWDTSELLRGLFKKMPTPPRDLLMTKGKPVLSHGDTTLTTGNDQSE